jgi:hypothetical protein
LKRRKKIEETLKSDKIYKSKKNDEAINIDGVVSDEDSVSGGDDDCAVNVDESAMKYMITNVLSSFEKSTYDLTYSDGQTVLSNENRPLSQQCSNIKIKDIITDPVEATLDLPISSPKIASDDTLNCRFEGPFQNDINIINAENNYRETDTNSNKAVHEPPIDDLVKERNENAFQVFRRMKQSKVGNNADSTLIRIEF